MPLVRCWQFFSDPRNLEKITPPSLRLHIKSELSPKIYPGLMVQYMVSPILGVPLKWLTEIVRVDEPHHFVDEQRIGPYRLWHHEHFFRELDEKRVEVRDLILRAAFWSAGRNPGRARYSATGRPHPRFPNTQDGRDIASDIR